MDQEAAAALGDRAPPRSTAPDPRRHRFLAPIWLSSNQNCARKPGVSAQVVASAKASTCAFAHSSKGQGPLRAGVVPWWPGLAPAAVALAEDLVAMAIEPTAGAVRGRGPGIPSGRQGFNQGANAPRSSRDARYR